MAESENRSWLAMLSDACMVCEERGQTNRDTEPYRTRLCLTHDNQLNRILMVSEEWQKWDQAKSWCWVTSQRAGRSADLFSRSDLEQYNREYFTAALVAHDFIAATIADMKAAWQKEHPDNG